MAKSYGHAFSARLAGKAFCSYCGLFLLNNPATRKYAAKLTCHRGDEE